MDSTKKFTLSQTLSFHTRDARCLDIYSNYLITGGTDKKVFLYSRSSPSSKWEMVHSYSFFPDWILDVTFMEGSNEFVTACKDNKIYVCSKDDSSAPSLVFEGHKKTVNCVRYKEFKIYSGSWDGTCKIWDLETGDVTATLGGAHPEFAVAVCP